METDLCSGKKESLKKYLASFQKKVYELKHLSIFFNQWQYSFNSTSTVDNSIIYNSA